MGRKKGCVTSAMRKYFQWLCERTNRIVRRKVRTLLSVFNFNGRACAKNKEIWPKKVAIGGECSVCYRNEEMGEQR